MSRLLFLCLACFSLLAHAQAYRWVDPATGRTVISDTPPPANVKTVRKAQDPGDNPEGRSYAVQKAVGNFPVTLYTSADCVAECKNARELLNGRGVPFAEKMVQSPEEAEELKKLVGDLFVPVLKVGRQSVRGFEAGSYNNVLDLAGYPKVAPPGSKPSGGLAK
jgi:glutaredoxin